MLFAGTAGWDIFAAIATGVAAVASVVAAAGVIAAFLSVRTGVDQIAEVRRDRHVQVLGGLAERWAGSGLEESRTLMIQYRSDGIADLVQAYFDEPGKNPEVETLLRVPNFYEDVAILVDSGGLDFDLVWRAFAGPALGCWAYWETAIRLIQGTDAGAYAEYERLVNTLRTRPMPTPEQLSSEGGGEALGAGQETPSHLHSNDQEDASRDR